VPFWIEGVVEVSIHSDEELEQPHAWSMVLDIGALVDVADPVSERLFGLSRACVSGEGGPRSLYAGRGLPKGHSVEGFAEMQRFPEIGGFTHATWREIKAAKIDPELLAGGDWLLIFDLLRRLEADDRFEDHRIRVLAWYNW